MTKILDSILIRAILGAIWTLLLLWGLKQLIVKASEDYKKEGIKGVIQEIALGIVSIVVFIILILLNPSQYVLPFLNILIPLYNLLVGFWNTVIKDLIGLPVTLPTFSPLS